jgi:FRG domain
MMLERFRELPETYLMGGAYLNVQPYRNEYSVYMHATPMDRVARGVLLVDELYGLAYDHIPAPGAAIYGDTAVIPGSDLDDRADLGFLRIPFARVPRCRVINRAQLESLIGLIPRRAKNSPLLFRGQTKEYLVGRSAETLEVLYADGEAREPSLLPSSVRAGLDIDEVLPEWAALLGWGLEPWVMRLDGGRRGPTFEQFVNFRTHYVFRRFAASAAQHYGMPSSGLDVTTSLDVALFFALHTFSSGQEPGANVNIVRVSPPSAPVLYVLEPFPERVQRDLLREWPTWLPLARPRRQAAHFLHRGWGLSQNEAARWVVGAFYLDPSGDFGTLPTFQELLPERDMFAALVSGLRTGGIGHQLPGLGRFLSYFQDVRRSST